jgi:hypothetical protein
MRLRSGVTFSGTHSVTLIVHRRADHRVGDAGVAGCRVKNDFAGDKLSDAMPSWIMRSAGRSFTEPPGFFHSAFAYKLDAGQDRARCAADG